MPDELRLERRAQLRQFADGHAMLARQLFGRCEAPLHGGLAGAVESRVSA